MKSILMVIKKLDARIRVAEEKMFCLSAAIEAATAKLDGMPKSNLVESKVERLAVRLADLRDEILTLKAVKVACRIELAQWLSEKIDNPNILKILLYRYGFLKKFNEIAELTNFSEPSVFRLHRAGLLTLNIRVRLSEVYEFDN